MRLLRPDLLVCVIALTLFQAAPALACTVTPALFQDTLDAAHAYHIRPLFLVSMFWTESLYCDGAKSSAGAIGIGQLMPATAKSLHVNPWDPHQNIYGSARYFRGLLDHFSDNYTLALAAYNAGPSAVRRWGGVPPYPETVAHIHTVYHIYKQLEQRYGADFASTR